MRCVVSKRRGPGCLACRHTAGMWSVWWHSQCTAVLHSVHRYLLQPGPQLYITRDLVSETTNLYGRPPLPARSFCPVLQTRLPHPLIAFNDRGAHLVSSALPARPRPSGTLFMLKMFTQLLLNFLLLQAKRR